MEHLPNSIAILTWGISNSGAITNIASALSKGFSDLGIQDIYILYINDSEENIEQGKNKFAKNVKFVHLGVRRTRWIPISLARFIKEVAPDVLISIAFLNIPAIMGWLLAGRAQTKLVISQQHSLIYKAYVEHKHDLGERLQLGLAKFLYPKVSGIVSTTPAIRTELLTQVSTALNPERVVAIPNMVDVDFIAQQAQMPPNHPWLSQKERPVVLSVGRLAKQKNFPLLLRAFRALRNQIDVKLMIVGEGSERPHLETLIQELDLEQDVSLPGFSNNPWSSMAQADVFVLPSEEEAFGLVLVEAMVCGAPVIATDALGGGPKHVLDDGQYGLLVPSQNEEQLSEAMLTVLTDVKLKKQLIEKANSYCQSFQPKTVTHQWLDFLNHIIKNGECI